LDAAPVARQRDRTMKPQTHFPLWRAFDKGLCQSLRP
jgi:hypothetical protein